MFGQFVREIPESTDNKTWTWLRKADLNIEEYFFEAQEKDLQRNHATIATKLLARVTIL